MSETSWPYDLLVWESWARVTSPAPWRSSRSLAFSPWLHVSSPDSENSGSYSQRPLSFPTRPLCPGHCSGQQYRLRVRAML